MTAATQSPLQIAQATHSSTSPTILVAVCAAVGAAILAGVIAIIIFIRRQKARKRRFVAPLITTNTKIRDVNLESGSLVCEPPSSEESNPVADWNHSRSAGRHRPLSGSSFVNAKRSDSGLRSHPPHVSRIPSSSREKSELSKDITPSSPNPPIPWGDQHSPPQMSQAPLQPLRTLANRSSPMGSSTPNLVR